MNEIYHVSLKEILPPSISSDEEVQRTAKAIEENLNMVSRLIPMAAVYARIDELPESVLDALAWQLHVDVYDEDVSLAQKRKLVKNAIKDHKYKGTPCAVKSVVEVLLNYAKVEEWYEYGGSPFHFRVSGESGHIPNGDKLQRLVDAINEVKNVRSWLDGVSFQRRKTVIKHLAVPVTMHKEIKVGMPDVGPQHAVMNKAVSIPTYVFKEVKVNG